MASSKLSTTRTARIKSRSKNSCPSRPPGRQGVPAVSARAQPFHRRGFQRPWPAAAARMRGQRPAGDVPVHQQALGTALHTEGREVLALSAMLAAMAISASLSTYMMADALRRFPAPARAAFSIAAWIRPAAAARDQQVHIPAQASSAPGCCHARCPPPAARRLRQAAHVPARAAAPARRRCCFAMASLPPRRITALPALTHSAAESADTLGRASKITAITPMGSTSRVDAAGRWGAWFHAGCTRPSGSGSCAVSRKRIRPCHARAAGVQHQPVQQARQSIRLLRPLATSCAFCR
jgi:hypothetical protein